MRTLLAMTGITLLAACQSGPSNSYGTNGTSTAGMPAGFACTANRFCASGVCGAGGTGFCCAQSCATTDPICGATSCDATGACVYPTPSTSCGAPTCKDSTLTQESCDGAGACDVGNAACPDNLTCAAGGACKTSCAGDTDCATGFVCIGQACVAPLATGACTEAQQCKSGICGIAGTGNCCAAACSNLAPPCGATSCDPGSGACLYPDTTTACGTTEESCSQGVQQNPTLCDGKGSCAPPGTTDCFPYECGATACATSCTDDSSCQSGGADFCDTTAAACCGSLSGGGLTVGGTIAVDAVNGSDATPCCGLAGAGPCQTLARALALIAAAKATGVSVVATVDGGGGDWAPAGEVYPIVLDLGVQVFAPGVFFFDPVGGQPEMFDVTSGNGYTASIVGTAAQPATIGMDSLGHQSGDQSSILVDVGANLALAAVDVNGSATNETNAILVAGNGSLTLGSAAGSKTGTVQIGNADPATAGWNGILCENGCQITDATLSGSSVVIEGQVNEDLDVEDNGLVYLTSSPVIGVAPSGPGFGTCPSKVDASASHGPAVGLNGKASVIFQNGTVQCIAGEGFDLTAANPNLPSLNLQNTIIQNTERAIRVEAGTAEVSGSTIRFNYNGVEQTTDGINDGTIELAGTAQSSNTIICSSRRESVDGGAPGVSVVNTTGSTLSAGDVIWDTVGPDTFDCDSTLMTCACDLASCSLTPGGDGMDIVLEAGSAISTTGHQSWGTPCEGL
jgi:hypothetical protein